MMASAYAGINILEMSTGNGALSCHVYERLGADVIKVEPSEGDPLWGSFGFMVWNRGKRSLKVDFSTDQAREVINRLIMNSDILIYDFASPLTKDLDLDFDSTRQQNSGLINCSVSPWGRSDLKPRNLAQEM